MNSSKKTAGHSSSRATRLSRALVSAIIVVALLFGTFLAYLYTFHNEKIKGDNEFSAPAEQVASYTPADFGWQAFQPLWGAGNSPAPALYPKLRVLAGTTPAGNTQLAAFNTRGEQLWQTDLGAPLVACSRTLSALTAADKDNALACLYNTGSTSGVTLVNIVDGTAHLIWQSNTNFVNVSAWGSQISLLGEDLSLLRIDVTGTIMQPFTTPTRREDPTLLPNLSECEQLAAGPLRPEFFDASHSNTWVVTRGGINYLIDTAASEIFTALPGHLMHAEDYSLWAISGQSGCAGGAIYNSQQDETTALAPGLIVPFTQSGTLPPYVMREGKFLDYSFSKNLPGKEAFSVAQFKDGGDKNVSLSHRKSGTVVSGGGELSFFPAGSNHQAWTLKVETHGFMLYSDVVIALRSDGVLAAYSTDEGKLLWQKRAEGIDANSAWNGFVRDDKTNHFYTASTGCVTVWGPNTARVFAPLEKQQIQTPAPAINYEVGECVRFLNSNPSAGRSYQTLSEVFVEKVSCSMTAAEPITQVIKNEQMPRGQNVRTAWAICSKNPISRSATVISSAAVKPEISGLCTGAISAREAAQNQGQNNPPQRESNGVFKGPGWQ